MSIGLENYVKYLSYSPIVAQKAGERGPVEKEPTLVPVASDSPGLRPTPRPRTRRVLPLPGDAAELHLCGGRRPCTPCCLSRPVIPGCHVAVALMHSRLLADVGRFAHKAGERGPAEKEPTPVPVASDSPGLRPTHVCARAVCCRSLVTQPSCTCVVVVARAPRAASVAL